MCITVGLGWVSLRRFWCCKVFTYYMYIQYINIKFIIFFKQNNSLHVFKNWLWNNFREKLKTTGIAHLLTLLHVTQQKEPTMIQHYQLNCVPVRFPFLLHPLLQKPIWNPHFREPSRLCSDLFFYTLTFFMSTVQYFYWTTLRCSVSENF